MTAPCILLLRASLNVEIAWPGHAGRANVWTSGWMCSSQLGTSANLMPCFHHHLSLRLLHPHPSPLLWHTLLSIDGVSLG